MKTVDIVIINWNAGELLSRCVKSVLQQGNKSFIGAVYVVDNYSSDDSVKMLAQDEKLYILQNNKNEGFAKACNQAFKKCTSEFVLLLNPDAILESSTLSDCIKFMQQHDEVDIMGCRLKDDAGHIAPSCARFPTPLRILNDATGLSKFFPKIFKPATLMTDWDHAESRKVDQVMGAFMFLRRSVFEKTGYFDERFFVYFEELDFSKRLAEINGISFYNKEIAIVHSGGGTTKRVKAFRLFLFLKSRMLYAKKHFSAPGVAIVFVATWVMEPIARILLALINASFKDVKAVFSAYRMLLFAK